MKKFYTIGVLSASLMLCAHDTATAQQTSTNKNAANTSKEATNTSAQETNKHSEVKTQETNSREFITGTKISIIPPAGFEKSNQFPGYFMKSNGSSLVVTALEGAPVTAVTSGFTEENLKKRNIVALSREKIQCGKHEGLLLHVSQKERGKEFLKWILALGDESNTFMILGTFPKTADKEVSKIIKTSMLSIEWKPEHHADPEDALTFSIKETDSLKVINKSGNNIVLGGSDDSSASAGGSATVAISASVTENWPAPEDEKVFTEYHLKQLVKEETYASVEIIDGKKITIDGLSCYFLHGKASIPKTNETVYFEHCILFEEDKYFVFHASVEYKRRDAFKKEFAKVLHSFKRK